MAMFRHHESFHIHSFFPFFPFLFPLLRLLRTSFLASLFYFSFSRLVYSSRSRRRSLLSSHISKLSATEMGATRAQFGTVPGRLAGAIVPRSLAVPVPFEDAARQETCVLAEKTPPPGEN